MEELLKMLAGAYEEKEKRSNQEMTTFNPRTVADLSSFENVTLNLLHEQPRSSMLHEKVEFVSTHVNV